MAQRRLKRLRAHAVSALSPAVASAARDRQLAHVLVETQNLWANFVRSYLISCLFSARRVNGQKVTLHNAMVQLPGHLLHMAAKAQKGPLAPAPTTRREEPSWHDVSVFVRTCQAIQCSHLADIQAALSIQGRACYDLPTFRNFYAHRNEESAQKALNLARTQYLIVGPRHPSEALSVPAKARPQPLLLDWLDEIDAMMELLCE